mmetsp:Transcript_66784/g.123353  ORF Transcript_66784/g.123353 Transcript_66784/m.123353 type:complete len:202 (-) Transcript_66784:208-813(-)
MLSLLLVYLFLKVLLFLRCSKLLVLFLLKELLGFRLLFLCNIEFVHGLLQLGPCLLKLFLAIFEIIHGCLCAIRRSGHIHNFGLHCLVVYFDLVRSYLCLVGLFFCFLLPLCSSPESFLLLDLSAERVCNVLLLLAKLLSKPVVLRLCLPSAIVTVFVLHKVLVIVAGILYMRVRVVKVQASRFRPVVACIIPFLAEKLLV